MYLQRIRPPEKSLLEPRSKLGERRLVQTMMSSICLSGRAFPPRPPRHSPSERSGLPRGTARPPPAPNGYGTRRRCALNGKSLRGRTDGRAINGDRRPERRGRTDRSGLPNERVSPAAWRTRGRSPERSLRLRLTKNAVNGGSRGRGRTDQSSRH